MFSAWCINISKKEDAKHSFVDNDFKQKSSKSKRINPKKSSILY